VQPYSIDVMPMFAPLHRIAVKEARQLLQGMDRPQILDLGAAAGEPAMSLATALPEAQAKKSQKSSI
jgi:chemotaxis methyl-accepting protein methylase